MEFMGLKPEADRGTSEPKKKRTNRDALARASVNASGGL
jgi:hypothetical protein